MDKDKTELEILHDKIESLKSTNEKGLEYVENLNQSITFYNKYFYQSQKQLEKRSVKIMEEYSRTVTFDKIKPNKIYKNIMAKLLMENEIIQNVLRIKKKENDMYAKCNESVNNLTIKITVMNTELDKNWKLIAQLTTSYNEMHKQEVENNKIMLNTMISNLEKMLKV